MYVIQQGSRHQNIAEGMSKLCWHLQLVGSTSTAAKNGIARYIFARLLDMTYPLIDVVNAVCTASLLAKPDLRCTVSFLKTTAKA